MALNDALRVELFNGQVFTEYQTLRLFEPAMMIYREGGIGERINFPVIETQVAQNLADGTTMSQNVLNPRAPELDLDDPIKAWVHIPKDLADVRPELELVTEYGNALGRDIANGETGRLIAHLGNACDTSAADSVVTANLDATSGLGAIVAAALRECASLLDANGVPGQGRWGMLHSTQWLELLDVEGVQSREWGGNANVKMPGMIIQYADFNIIRGTGGFFGTDFTGAPYATAWASKYRYDATNLRGIFWHREAWALRRVRRPEVLVDWLPETDEWKVEARSHMGTACIKEDDGIIRLENA